MQPCLEIRIWSWWKFKVLDNDLVREYLQKNGFNKVCMNYMKRHIQREYLRRPKANEPDYRLYQPYWPEPFRYRPSSSTRLNQTNGFLDKIEGLYESHLSPNLPFKIVRHPHKGLILISTTSILKHILDKVYGYAQWVNPTVILKYGKAFEKHDCKVTDNEGRIFVLVGPIAIVSQECNSPLRIFMSDEWLKTLKSSEQKILVQANLEEWRKGIWKLNPGDEVTIWYGEGGVEYCCCDVCAKDERMRP